MEENTQWRAKAFPIQADPKTEKILVKIMINRDLEPFISVGEIRSIDLF